MQKKHIFGIIIALLLAISPICSIAQNTLKGFVYEAQTGEPIMFANVYLKGTSYGSATDENGYFNITKISNGTYTICVTTLGYDTITEQISLTGGSNIIRKFNLNETAQRLETVNITADKIEAQTETKTAVITVTPKTITKIPSIGGQADLAQYLQVVPGVVFTGDQGGQLYIRGGSPIQNKVLLDGMVVYNPFHSIGLFSVFDTDIIRNADVYTGGFGAEYGGRISSIMNISTRDGNKKHIAGKVGLSTFGAKLTLEGPLLKPKGEKGTGISFILSAKGSYLEQTSKYIYKYASPNGLPFNYLDAYGKMSIVSGNGSKFNLFGFSFNDRVNNYALSNVASGENGATANPGIDFGWRSFGGGGNFLVIPGKSPAMIEGCVAYSSYKSTMKEENSPDRYSSINGFNVGFDFSYFLSKGTLKFGTEVNGYTTDYETYSTYGGYKISAKDNSTEIGIYAKYKATFGKFLFEPSFRLQWYASMSKVSPEPRLAMKYNITDRIRVKAAAGMYSQNFVAATSDRDVVNLFYGFMSGIENIPSKFNGKEVKSSLQKANHIVGGFEFDIPGNITANIEGYWKNFNQLTNINRSKLFEDNAQNIAVPDLLKKDFMIEKGNAYGFDVSLKFENKNWYVWAVYALGFVNRNYEHIVDGNVVYSSYAPHFDRRHNVNVLVTYTCGKKRQWEFSGRWNFGSGFPFTQIKGFYEYLPFQNDGIFFDYTQANGELGVLYGDLNEGRLPTYHRFDIDAKRRFYFTERVNLEIDISVTNIYNRANVFYVDIVSSKTISQLPILPSLGLTLTF